MSDLIQALTLRINELLPEPKRGLLPLLLQELDEQTVDCPECEVLRADVAGLQSELSALAGDQDVKQLEDERNRHDALESVFSVFRFHVCRELSLDSTSSNEDIIAGVQSVVAANKLAQETLVQINASMGKIEQVLGLQPGEKLENLAEWFAQIRVKAERFDTERMRADGMHSELRAAKVLINDIGKIVGVNSEWEFNPFADEDDSVLRKVRDLEELNSSQSRRITELDSEQESLRDIAGDFFEIAEAVGFARSIEDGVEGNLVNSGEVLAAVKALVRGSDPDSALKIELENRDVEIRALRLRIQQWEEAPRREELKAAVGKAFGDALTQPPPTPTTADDAPKGPGSAVTDVVKDDKNPDAQAGAVAAKGQTNLSRQRTQIDRCKALIIEGVRGHALMRQVPCNAQVLSAARKELEAERVEAEAIGEALRTAAHEDSPLDAAEQAEVDGDDEETDPLLLAAFADEPEETPKSDPTPPTQDEVKDLKTKIANAISKRDEFTKESERHKRMGNIARASACKNAADDWECKRVSFEAELSGLGVGA